MIFQTIYDFFYNLFYLEPGTSVFLDTFYWDFGEGPVYMYDYFSVLATIVVIALGVVALFRILGGVLKLFKV